MKDVATRQSCAESTLIKLRSDITLGVLAPGAPLAEAAVARQMGISRVPVREALFTLEREGLIEFSATGRAYVKHLKAQDFEELYQLRLALEPLACRLASPRLRFSQTALEQNIKATAKAGSLPEVTRLDLDFHQIILLSCGNTRLKRIWISLRSELELWLARMHFELDLQSKAVREMTVEAHTDFITTFKSQPAGAAERLCRQHIQGWHEFMSAMTSSVNS
jgi:DNA-binding GntR family transcriptional regulator